MRTSRGRGIDPCMGPIEYSFAGRRRESVGWWWSRESVSGGGGGRGVEQGGERKEGRMGRLKQGNGRWKRGRPQA